MPEDADEFKPVEMIGGVCLLYVPADWEVVEQQEPLSLFAVAPESDPEDFRVNVALVQTPLGPGEGSSGYEALQAQAGNEDGFQRIFEDYRLLHLDEEEFGQPPKTGAMRSAFYVNEEGIPLMMHQWAGRHRSQEVSLTVTFAAEDAPVWGPNGHVIASRVEWSS